MLRKISLVLALILFTATGNVFAGDKALSIKSSNPQDGAVDIPVDTAVVLEFSNNVVNMTVAENNSGCFRMLNTEGLEIEIDVYLPDDQIEPENKRTITLTPVQPLTAGTAYIIVISPDLTAKNGSLLGSEQTVSFTTAE